MLREPIPGRVAAGLLDVLGDIGGGLGRRQREDQLHRGPAVRFGERGRDVEEWRTIVGGAVVVDELLVRFDHVVRRQVRIVDAVRAVHGVAPVATGAQVLAVGGQREAARPPPFRDLLRQGPRIPHRAHRRVVDACEPDLVRAVSGGHFVLLLSWARASCVASCHGLWRWRRCDALQVRIVAVEPLQPHGTVPIDPIGRRGQRMRLESTRPHLTFTAARGSPGASRRRGRRRPPSDRLSS